MDRLTYEIMPHPPSPEKQLDTLEKPPPLGESLRLLRPNPRIFFKQLGLMLLYVTIALAVLVLILIVVNFFIVPL